MIEYYVHPSIDNIQILYKHDGYQMYVWNDGSWIETPWAYLFKLAVTKDQIYDHPAFAKERFYEELLQNT